MVNTLNNIVWKSVIDDGDNGVYKAVSGYYKGTKIYDIEEAGGEVWMAEASPEDIVRWAMRDEFIELYRAFGIEDEHTEEFYRNAVHWENNMIVGVSGAEFEWDHEERVVFVKMTMNPLEMIT